MNGPRSSDSVAALLSICSATEDHRARKNRGFERGFQSPFEEDDCGEESGYVSGKKRRLGSEQVKALEKNFELDNKLEPERKMELARDLGLQPRQVAVWFQNRRARWKTKQLERDYDVLRSSYDAMKLRFDSLRRENEDLLQQIEKTKAKVLEETTMADSTGIDQTSPPSDNPFTVEAKSKDFHCQSYINNNGGESASDEGDSSAISSSSGSPLNRFEIQKSFQLQLDVKMEEQDLFGGEEGCSFFSADEAPTLQWCYEDQWG